LIKFLLYIYLIVIIFFGNVNPFQYRWIISYVDFANIVYLIFFFIYGVLNKRKYIYSYTKLDVLLLSLTYFLTFPPLLLNEIINYNYFYSFFYSIRIFMTYKILSFIYYEYQIKYKRIINIEDFFKPLLFLALISGAISIIKYFPFWIGDLFNDIWPVVSNGQIVDQLYWGRLWGTMGGTNTAGNFFTVAACTSLYMYLKKSQTVYKYHFIFFSLCVLLSLSFSSIVAYIIINIYLLNKNINYKILILAGLIAITFTVVINQNDVFRPLIEVRFNRNIDSESIVPKNLQARFLYWEDYINKVFDDKLHFIYGYGPGGVRHLNTIHGNPESFYFRIFNESGFIGILSYFVLFRYIFIRLKVFNKSESLRNEKTLISIILALILIQSIGNEPIYSNGVTQIFAFLLFYVSYQYSLYKYSLISLK